MRDNTPHATIPHGKAPVMKRMTIYLLFVVLVLGCSNGKPEQSSSRNQGKSPGANQAVSTKDEVKKPASPKSTGPKFPTDAMELLKPYFSDKQVLNKDEIIKAYKTNVAVLSRQREIMGMISARKPDVPPLNEALAKVAVDAGWESFEQFDAARNLAYQANAYFSLSLDLQELYDQTKDNPAAKQLLATMVEPLGKEIQKLGLSLDDFKLLFELQPEIKAIIAK